MVTDTELKMRGKIQYFYEEQIKVHVKRFDKTFWNGKIIAVRGDGVYTFLDHNYGEMILFACDVKDVIEYKEGARK